MQQRWCGVEPGSASERAQTKSRAAPRAAAAGREGGQRCKEDTEKSVGGRGRRPKVKTIADARMRLASHLGYAARKIWRRHDLDSKDEIVLDLVCEALYSIFTNFKFLNFDRDHHLNATFAKKEKMSSWDAGFNRKL